MTDMPGPIFAVELSERAYIDISESHLYVKAASGAEAADIWIEGLWQAIESLQATPYRSLAPENDRFRYEVRQIAHRRPGASYQHRILYVIDDKNVDGAVVRIMHVRHASKNEIDRWEAAILQQQMELSSQHESANGSA